MPAPTPPKITSPSWMFTSGHQAAERREAVVHGVHRAAGGVGGDRRVERRGGDAEARLLPLHVAERLVNRQPRERAVAGGLGVVAGGDAGEEEHAHRREQHPPLLLVPGHPAVRVGERRPGSRR